MDTVKTNAIQTLTNKTFNDAINIITPNADAIVLGSATEEGGDIKIYRDTSGNLAFSLDADAASNAKALDIYGGVVAQNYLTVGQTSLNTGYNLFVFGTTKIQSALYTGQALYAKGLNNVVTNTALLYFNIDVTGTDTTDHSISTQIDANDIIVAKATGDGAGGVTDFAIGFFGTTPQTQQAHIVDADGQLADITTKFNTLLADLEGYGILASS